MKNESKLLAGKQNAVLDKMFIFPEGRMTRRQWLIQRKNEGCIAHEQKVRQWKKEEKEREDLKWIFGHMPFGNQNHPQCIEYRRRMAVLEDGFLKMEYYIQYPDRSSITITKIEYDMYINGYI